MRQNYLRKKVTELEERIDKTSERVKHLKKYEWMFQALYPSGKETGADGDPNVPPPALTEAQSRRLMMQGNTVAEVYEALCKRDRLELVHAKAGAEAADRADFEAMEAATNAMGEARRNSTIKTIAQEVQKDRPFVATSTVLVWCRECERLKGYFSADSRGKSKNK